jgi:hypothetical protein
MNQLGNQLELFGQQLGREHADARKIAAGPGEAADEAGLDRIDAGSKTIGIVEVAFFAASAEGMLPVAITSTLRPTRSAANPGNRS